MSKPRILTTLVAALALVAATARAADTVYQYVDLPGQCDVEGISYHWPSYSTVTIQLNTALGPVTRDYWCNASSGGCDQSNGVLGGADSGELWGKVIDGDEAYITGTFCYDL